MCPSLDLRPPAQSHSLLSASFVAFYCGHPLSVLPCAALRCVPIIDEPLILANLSFLRWSGCSAWQCRCCRLLSPWLANLKRPPPQPCTPQVGRAEPSGTDSAIHLIIPRPQHIPNLQGMCALVCIGTSNFTLVETLIAEHLVQQMVVESAPQPAQRTASNPSIDH